ncbi:Aste57867_20499 [Aphanomyces stellatus]|uniref:Aste57867_20499 protein n=1 Tax=Aphanomyces stellatus TaxID=120398 RepID=A0A485LF42_9STRA|nr:hypothetical protein As57867_020433 [Aphanomyces stellatus]VFT97184.1 Aste57867_20499 [Aphanomyces stellatus]
MTAPLGLEEHERREYECQRKRRYRAGKRTERERLEADAEALRLLLSQLVSEAAGPTTAREAALRSLQELATSERLNKTLRHHMQRRRDLVMRLKAWVRQSMSRPRSLHSGTPWLHSALLADPTARQYGYQWLTDRIYHAAMAAHGVDGHVDDVARLQVHRDVDGWDIVAMESHYQCTFLTPLAELAQVKWVGLTEDAFSDVVHATTVDATPTFLYKYIHDTLLHTNVCWLNRRYDVSPDRVVLVSVLLYDDECFPLRGNEQRAHGFSWTILEKITDDITLHRTSILHHAPRTADGSLSFDETAAMFGVEPHPSRDTTLARIENNALQNFIARWAFKKRVLDDRLGSQR